MPHRRPHVQSSRHPRGDPVAGPHREAAHAATRRTRIRAGAACAPGRFVRLPDAARRGGSRETGRVDPSGNPRGEVGQVEQGGTTLSVPVKERKMSDLTRSGTVERESMEGCELAAVLDDYRAWIDGQGFSQGSATDHITKLTHFWPFLTRRGLLTGDRVHWHHI